MSRELRDRPLLWVALMLAAGCAAWFYPWAVLVAAPLALLLPNLGLRVAGLAFLALGALIGPRPQAPLLETKPFSGDAYVVQAPRPSRSGEQAIVEASGRKFVLYYSANQPVALGDLLLLRGVAKPVPERMRAYWSHQGVTGILEVTGSITRHRAGPAFGQWGQASRRSFIQFSREELSPRAGAIVQAVCFNHDTGLDTLFRDKLARSGIIHIISTSGMHVVLVAGFLSVVLALLPIPRWAQVGLLIAILLVYGAAAGFRPPMVRSILMAGLWASAYLFKREADGLSLVAASAIGTLLIQPSAIFDLGLILSFVTITALVLFVPPGPRDDTTVGGWFWKRGKQIALTSLVATVASAPVLAYFFGQFSVVGVLSNLLVVPVVPVVVSASLLGWLLSPLMPGVSGALLQGVVEPLAWWIIAVAEGLGGQPWAAVTNPPIPAWAVWLFYGFALMLWRPRLRGAAE